MSEVLQETKLSRFTENLPKTTLAFPKEILERAQHTLQTSDFPTTRTEAWKYTRLGKIQNNTFTVSKPVNVSEINRKVSETPLTFVFENGFLVKDCSSEIPAGLTIRKLSDCTEEDLKLAGSELRTEEEVFHALNTVYATDGLLIRLEAKTELNQTIQLVHVQKGEQRISNLRNLVVCEKFSKMHLVQQYITEGGKQCFTNAVTEAFVGENAFLTINKLQYEAEDCLSVTTEEVVQDRSSTFTINTFTLNGALVRNNLNIRVKGENCTTHLNGAYLLKDAQHVDNHTVVDHLVANCESFELYKGVMDDRSTGVFNGKVFVRKDAQKINAFQSNGNVLLSDDATIDSKPELEIYADDVKCSHGSTTGQLDEEAIFYLRSRGISEKAARQLLVSAFVTDVLEKTENEEVDTYIRRILHERFGWDF